MGNGLVRFLKDLLRPILRPQPKGLNLGENVTFAWPRRHILAPERVTIGDRSTVGHHALIEPIVEYAGVRYDPTITIGKDVYIGPYVYMVTNDSITIGDGCVLSESVFLSDNGHGLDPDAGLIMKQPLVKGRRIEIGKNCFIGLRAAIMPGVTLGEHCVVGINSVVTKSFPAYSMIGGAPAKLVRQYSPEKKAWISPEQAASDSNP